MYTLVLVAMDLNQLVAIYLNGQPRLVRLLDLPHEKDGRFPLDMAVSVAAHAVLELSGLGQNFVLAKRRPDYIAAHGKAVLFLQLQAALIIPLFRQTGLTLTLGLFSIKVELLYINFILLNLINQLNRKSVV